MGQPSVGFCFVAKDLLGLASDPLNVIHFLGSRDIGRLASTQRLSSFMKCFVRVSRRRTSHSEDIQGVVLLLAALTFCGVFVLSPVATVLIEMFPVRIRYTGMSSPYHLASGWVGGLLPTVSSTSAQASNICYGLRCPIFWAALSFVVALISLRETRHVDINAESERCMTMPSVRGPCCIQIWRRPPRHTSGAWAISRPANSLASRYRNC